MSRVAHGGVLPSMPGPSASRSRNRDSISRLTPFSPSETVDDAAGGGGGIETVEVPCTPLCEAGCRKCPKSWR